MNYRINLPLEVVEQDALAGGSYSRLLQYDQLSLQRASQRVYFGFGKTAAVSLPTADKCRELLMFGLLLAFANNRASPLTLADI